MIIFLELGHQRYQITLTRTKEAFRSRSKQKNFLNAILEVEALIAAHRTKRESFQGISWQQEMSQGIFPRFKIDLTMELSFAYSIDEFENLKKTDEEAQRKRHDRHFSFDS